MNEEILTQMDFFITDLETNVPTDGFLGAVAHLHSC